MRCIGSYIAKEGIMLILIDERFCFIEPYIGAISFKLSVFSIIIVMIIKIIIVPVVIRIAYRASTMIDRLLKSHIQGSARIIIPQVPLTEHGSRITVIPEYFCHGFLILPQQRPAGNGMPDACPVIISAGQKSGSCRSARGRDMEICQPNTNLP